MKKIILPRDVDYIISQLNKSGYEAYAVGGCIRDCLLDKPPKDWDITTSALPLQVKALFSHTYDTGIKHGTVTVLIGKTGYEVTTYRLDGKYTDSRHPDTVEFTFSLEEDLARRDFTMNAIAYSPTLGFADCFGGMEDIRQGIIRAVRNPSERFREDALRMLRALRFSALLGFEIEENTYRAIKENAQLIKNISMERIRDELFKLLLSPRPLNIYSLRETGLADYALPKLLRPLSDREAEIRSFLPMVKADIVCRLALLLHSLDCKERETLLRSLRADNKTIKRVITLSEYINNPIDITPCGIRRAVSETSFEMTEEILYMQSLLSGEDRSNQGIALLKEIRERGDCCSVSELKINGEALKKMGIEGKKIGLALGACLNEVLKEPQNNNEAYLIDFVKEEQLCMRL